MDLHCFALSLLFLPVHIFKDRIHWHIGTLPNCHIDILLINLFIFHTSAQENTSDGFPYKKNNHVSLSLKEKIQVYEHLTVR
jgi:hypothetical protein